MVEPSEVAKSFFVGILIVCIVGALIKSLEVVALYGWDRLAGMSFGELLAIVLGGALLAAALGYVRQYRLVRWVAAHVPAGTDATVVSRGSLKGLRKYVHQSDALPALHACTPEAIIAISAILSPIEYVNVRSLELVRAFEGVEEAPRLTSVQLWGFMVRVRTHQADGICVYRTESGAGIVAYVDTGKFLADATHFWRSTSSVEEALAIAERASGAAAAPAMMKVGQA